MDGYYLFLTVAVPSALGFILAIGPFRQALTQRLAGRPRDTGAESGWEHALAEQGDRLAAAERRVEQLEERLDFAERLLSQRPERARLAEPE